MNTWSRQQRERERERAVGRDRLRRSVQAGTAEIEGGDRHSEIERERGTTSFGSTLCLRLLYKLRGELGV